jgi:hypothetical protein
VSKRPLIFELIDNFSGDTLYSSDNREDAFKEIRQMLINKPELRNNVSFIILQNGREVKLLAHFDGRELDELLEDED